MVALLKTILRSCCDKSRKYRVGIVRKLETTETKRKPLTIFVPLDPFCHPISHFPRAARKMDLAMQVRGRGNRFRCLTERSTMDAGILAIHMRAAWSDDLI